MPPPTPQPSAPLPEWWTGFWSWVDASQFRAGLASTLLAAAVLGVLALIPKLRRPAILAIRRAWAFILSVRLTTTTRIEAAKEAAVKKFRDGLAPNPEHVMMGKPTHKELTVRLTVPPEEEAPPSAEAGTQDVPAAPPQGPKAMWYLSFAPTIVTLHRDARLYKLTNHAEDANPTNVRIVSDGGRVAFPYGAYWASVPAAEEQRFVGVSTGIGGDGPLVFTITWKEDEREFSASIVAIFSLV